MSTGRIKRRPWKVTILGPKYCSEELTPYETSCWQLKTGASSQQVCEVRDAIPGYQKEKSYCTWSAILYHRGSFFAKSGQVADVSSVKSKAGNATTDFEIMVILTRNYFMDISNVLTCGNLPIYVMVKHRCHLCSFSKRSRRNNLTHL